MTRVNVDGTDNMMAAAHAAGVGKADERCLGPVELPMGGVQPRGQDRGK